MEVVSVEVVSDLLSEHRSLPVGGAEVDASPDSGVDYFFERVRKAVKAPRRTGLIAEGAESDPVIAEEVLQRVHERTGHTSVSRGMLGERWRHEQRRITDWRRWVE